MIFEIWEFFFSLLSSILVSFYSISAPTNAAAARQIPYKINSSIHFGTELVLRRAVEMCFFPRSRIDLKFELLKYLLQFGRLYNLSCRQSKWWWWGPVLRIDVEPPSTILQADFFLFRHTIKISGKPVPTPYVYRHFSCVCFGLFDYIFALHICQYNHGGDDDWKKMITYPLKYHILTYLKFHKVAAYHKIAFHSYLMPYIWPGPE